MTTSTMPTSIDDIRMLATAQLPGPVLSIVLRTDPRDPANTRHTPAWQISLRTALQDIGEAVERDGSREQRLALRELAPAVQRELAELPADQRGRGLAWFVTADRSLDRRYVLQLPPSGDAVRWDARPYVVPLIEVVDRGQPVAIVLVASDSLRLVRWEQGQATEPGRSVYDLELGDWRDYAAYAAANPARGQQTVTNVEAYEQRVDAWRQRFYRATGATIADRLAGLGVSRVLIAGERGLTQAFAELMPPQLGRDVLADAAENLSRADPAAVAERVEGRIIAERIAEARRAAEDAVQAAREGRPAALGPDETLQALAASRVDRLVLDPGHVFPVARLGSAAARALRRPEDDMVAECAVELAVAGGAEITAVEVRNAPVLAEADGMAATLRY